MTLALGRIAALVAVLHTAGCYHYSFAGSSTTEVRSTRVIGVWGITADNTPVTGDSVPHEYCRLHPQDFRCLVCSSSGIRDVQVSSNLLYALVTVVTLGFVNLLDVSYRCAPQTGEQPFP